MPSLRSFDLYNVNFLNNDPYLLHTNYNLLRTEHNFLYTGNYDSYQRDELPNPNSALADIMSGHNDFFRHRNINQHGLRWGNDIQQHELQHYGYGGCQHNDCGY